MLQTLGRYLSTLKDLNLRQNSRKRGPLAILT